jgi:hypothetical protein
MSGFLQKTEILDTVLSGLMRRYKERVPDVKKILSAMVTEGIIKNENDIENDHIAFRTMGVPQLGVHSFEKIFLKGKNWMPGGIARREKVIPEFSSVNFA